MYKILLRRPSHKLQSISTSLQFSKISTGSLSLNGLSIKSGASEIWFLCPLQSHWLTLWCQAGLIIVIHYILAWASRTSRNSSMYKILLRRPSHKLQSISTSLQFSKISTGSLSLNGLSIKSLFSLSRPSWMASPLIFINIVYLRHITHQPDHLKLLLFSFQELEHRLVSARSLLLLQGYGTLLLYAQQPPLLFDLNSKLTSSKLPFLPRLFSLLPDWYYGLMHWVIHVWAPSNDILYILDTVQ